MKTSGSAWAIAFTPTGSGTLAYDIRQIGRVQILINAFDQGVARCHGWTIADGDGGHAGSVIAFRLRRAIARPTTCLTYLASPFGLCRLRSIAVTPSITCLGFFGVGCLRMRPIKGMNRIPGDLE